MFSRTALDPRVKPRDDELGTECISSQAPAQEREEVARSREMTTEGQARGKRDCAPPQLRAISLSVLAPLHAG